MPTAIAEAFVTIRPDFSGFQAAIESALGTSMQTAGAKAAQDLDKSFSQNLSNFGKTSLKAGAALTAGLTVPIVAVGKTAISASVDFETAFTSVAKTVSATDEQLDGLRQGIRDMAKEIPVTTTELSNIAAEAGQLGIGTDHILEFTRVMAGLGEATNLSAVQAGDALARIANITQLPQTEFERLGSTLVALGNDSASTESEIAEMSLRIAGAAHTVGISTPDVLSFAAALSSVGIDAEAGGSAISRVMVSIAQSVSEGGKKLKLFAEVAGESSAEFSKSFKEHPTEAIVAFVEGLKKINDAGGDTFAVLEQLGFDQIRVRQALLGLANAGDLLQHSIDTGNSAWIANTALMKEVDRRYATSASQWQIFKNKLNDVAITLGNTLVPELIKLIDKAEPLLAFLVAAVQGFAKLPEPVQITVFAITGLVAVFGPLLVIIGAVSLGISALVPLFVFMTGPIGIAILATVALGVSLVVLSQTFDDFENSAGPSFEAFGSIVSATFSTVASIFEGFSPVVSSVLSALGALADGFIAAFDAILSVVLTVGRLIFQAMDLLSPFHHESPSLVDNVNAGRDAIIAGYRGMADATALLEGARGPIDSLGDALQGLTDKLDKMDDSRVTEAISAFGGDVAVQLFHDAQAALYDLGQAYDDLGPKIDVAEAAVKGLKEQLDAAKDAFRGFASATLAESLPFDKALNDLNQLILAKEKQINTLKQKGPLTKDVVTVTTDKSGKRHETHKTVDTALGTQVKGLEGELDKLRLKAEGIRLDKEIAIGPLTDQIKKLTDANNVLSFAQIIQGLKDSKAQIDILTPAYEGQNKDLGIMKDQYKALGDQIKITQAQLDKMTGAATGEFDRMTAAAEAAARAAEAAAKKAKADAEAAARKEEAGPSIDDVLAGLKDLDLSKTSQDFSDITEKADNFAVKAQAVSDKVSGIADAFERWKPLIGLIAAIVTVISAVIVVQAIWNALLLANPVILIIAGLILAGIAIYTFRDQILGAFGDISDTLGPTVAKIRDIIVGGFEFVVKWVEEHWPGIQDKIEAPFEALKSGADGVFGLVDRLTPAMDGMNHMFSSGFKGIHDEALIEFGDVRQKSGPIWAGVRDEAVKPVLEMYKRMLNQLILLELLFAGLGGRILRATGNLLGVLVQKGKDLITGFVKGMTSVHIPNPLSLVPGTGIAKRVIGSVTGHAAGLWNVPGIRGLGDIYPALLSPGEMVIPAAHADVVRAMAKRYQHDDKGVKPRPDKRERPQHAGDYHFHFNGPLTVVQGNPKKSPRQTLEDVGFATGATWRAHGIWNSA